MHDHTHAAGDHSHSHSHAPKDFGFAFALGTALNLGFVVIEAIFGVISNSTALLADAGHNLGDVIGLLVAWGAAVLAKRPPTERFTYGLRSSSILAALGNALLLIFACGAIAWEAIGRFSEPKPIEGMTVIVVAGIGILVNGFTAWLFVSGRKTDLNIRGAYLHMVADAGVSLGVVIAGAAMMLTGWLWLDPVTSLVIVAIVLWSTWGLLRDSINLALAGVPAHIELSKVKACLEQLPGVTRAHHVHVWGMSTNEVALTAHLVMPGGHPGNTFFKEAAHELRERFGIAHPTLQIETGEGADDESH
ncbi:cation diffusion facilitator family transporter [Pseudorhodoplanes sinuspersici]|uniref:Cation transporter n=1 Tax=Pseudorhodoplanes sinuspersici TaxID=1235591 RepID=A0A1W6ZL25_9HYPH|nr:cation diffusion facilitator family transporter [Pseudorhodoplanes sinuspersici]ARP97955.1 cation transporter [Pseudorhodoplanes sinuspersici]RKE68298.1 cobalt-zinc-cadmium efflux system protein [Pseudorhodoplanes sinuspersici]